MAGTFGSRWGRHLVRDTNVGSMSSSSVSKRRRRLMERRARMELLRHEEEAVVEAEREVAPGTRATDDAWVDLLHETPLAPTGIDVLRASLRFAFESGDAGGMLRAAVDRAPVAPSSWEPEGFSHGLFLPELVSTCFTIKVGNVRFEPSRERLQRIVTRPPDDIRDVHLRQEVLRELDSKPTLRACLGEAYADLRTLRNLLDEQPMTPGETIRRKVEVLGVIQSFFDRCDEGLHGASSAVSRLHAFAQRVRSTDAYGRLNQVLDFDRNMAQVEVRVVVGSDGKIRDFELMKNADNLANPLVRSSWSRAWSRFVAWLRGHRYGENEVLLRVLDEVFAALEDDVLPLFRLIGDLELYLANLGFRDRARDEGLAVCLAELHEAPGLDANSGPFKIEGLFNPLLFLQDVEPVPCSIETSGHDAMVLVTGPNSGGKTRLLQALALAQLFGQNGLFVPASKAALTRAPNMFVSLVEEAPADQKEGRLGTELLRVRRLFEKLAPGSLVILDELCSGTNPSEGIAIFEMVISLLPRLRPQVFLTTHFLDAARKLETEAPIERLAFLQVELDEDAKPTFQFVPGVAPTSLAHRVASRLGVTQEELEKLVEAQIARAEDPN